MRVPPVDISTSSRYAASEHQDDTGGGFASYSANLSALFWGGFYARVPPVTRSGIIPLAQTTPKALSAGELSASRLDHEVVGEIHPADAPSPKRACPSVASRDFSPWGDRVSLSYGQDDLELFRAVLWGPHPPLRGPPSPAGKAFCFLAPNG